MLAAKQLARAADARRADGGGEGAQRSPSNVAGFVTRGDGVQAVYTLAPFLFAYGGRWLDEKGKPELGIARVHRCD